MKIQDGLTRRVCCLLLTLLTLAVFSQVYRCDFLDMDDDAYIWMNSHIQKGLTWEGLQWAFTADLTFNSPNADYWQPVTMISRMIDIQLFGLEPSMHHLINLLFHIVNVLLVFHLLFRATKEMIPCVFTAAYFAVHPFKVQSVVWVTERKDVLSGMFFFLTLLAYWNYTEKPGRKRWMGVCLLFVLGMLTKPIIMTLPFLILLLDYWPLKRVRLSWQDLGKWWGLVREKRTLFMLDIITVCMPMIWFRNHVVGERNELVWPLHVIHTYAFHFYKALFPAVSIFYAPEYDVWVGDFRVLFGGVLLLALMLWTFRNAKRFPWIWVGMCWFLGVFAPVIFAPIRPDDRFFYLPSVGLGIVLVWGAWLVIRKWRVIHKLGVFALLTWIGTLSVITYSEVPFWKNSQTLYKHTLDHQPFDWFFWNNLGVANLRYNQDHESLGCFLKAVRLCGGGDKERFPQYNVCQALISRHYTMAEMKAWFDRLKLRVFLDPDLGTMMLKHVEVALSMDMLDRAMDECRFILELEPEDFRPQTGMAILLFRLGRLEESAEFMRKVNAPQEEMKRVQNKLAWILSTQESLRAHHTQEAIQLASTLCQETQFQNPVLLDTLAAAYAGEGQFERAIVLIRSAEEWADKLGNQELLKGIRRHIRWIQMREPINSQGQQFPEKNGFVFRMEPLE